MPSFLRFPKEAEIIGRLLAGYGEIEYDLSCCLEAAINDGETARRSMFRVRGEKQRIDVADALMRHKYKDSNLLAEYDEAIAATHSCRKIRNQYSHCH